MRRINIRLGWLHISLLAVTLAAMMVGINGKIRVDRKSRYLENVAVLEQLRHLDRGLSLAVYKQKAGIAVNRRNIPTSPQFDSVLNELRTSIRQDGGGEDAQLNREMDDYSAAFKERERLANIIKTYIVEQQQASQALPGAAERLKRSLRFAGRFDLAHRNLVDRINEAMTAGLSSGASDLPQFSADSRLLSPETRQAMEQFSGNLRALSTARVEIERLLRELSAVPTMELSNSIQHALQSSYLRAAAQSARYSQFMLAFSLALTAVFLYAALRLTQSHTAARKLAQQLKEANENLERRVGERTQDLENSLGLLNATLESSTDGILAYQFEGEKISCNSRCLELWGMPPRMSESAIDDMGRIEWMAGLVTDSQRFAATARELKLGRCTDAFHVFELKDGRTFEMYLRPQRVNHETVGVVISFRDISERKRAERELHEANQHLVHASRQAGMAEVATNVLHNVGNVLNSLNVSVNLLKESVKKSKVSGVAKLASLFESRQNDLAHFITSDPNGRHLPGYVLQLSQQLAKERNALAGELESLQYNVDHIKQIVAMQQNYSKVGTVREAVAVAELVEHALQVNADALRRHGVHIVREFDAVPPLNLDRHRILQILVNLIANAKHACGESDRARSEQCVTIRIAAAADTVRISVTDNGVGIAAENMTRIFNHGFTTRKDGHGFGLHSGALDAQELGGSLRAHSEGLGRGATFTLELPLSSAFEHHGVAA